MLTFSIAKARTHLHQVHQSNPFLTFCLWERKLHQTDDPSYLYQWERKLHHPRWSPHICINGKGRFIALDDPPILIK